jgi:hypothetical protein
MFSWLRKKAKPAAPPPAAPGPVTAAGEDSGDGAVPDFGTKVRVAFANGTRTWEEETDLVAVLERTLVFSGHPVTAREDHVVHKDTGIVLRPTLCGFQPMDGGGVRTATIMRANHPAFRAGGPDAFEYQHSTGDTIEASVAAGFNHWRQLDLPVLVEALRDKLEHCTAMEMTFPAAGDAPARTRRVVLGPVAHFRQHEPPPGSAPQCAPGGDGSKPADHDFCPCCLFSRTIEAFKPLVESDGFYAIRFYAARDENGVPQADCRVNGEDSDAGKAALIKYAASWPPAGFEFRKQYVVIQSIPTREAAETEVTRPQT